MDEGLKPCPFCGGSAEITLFLSRKMVACTECFACILPDVNSIQTDEEKELKFVIRQWNRRANDAE